MDSPILLVTEDASLTGPLAASLAPKGFRLATCEPARCVVEAAAALPTLVLLDLEIRSALWQTVLGALLAEPRTRSLPVVALTRTRGQDAVLLVIAGAHDVLTLPLDARAIDTLGDLLVALSFQFGSGVSDVGAAAADRLVLFAERHALDGTLSRTGGSATFSQGALTDARFGASTGRAALAALLSASGDLRFEPASAAEPVETIEATDLELIEVSSYLGIEDPPAATVPVSAPRVLAVDDDPDLAVLIEAFLQSQGFLVETASDGEEGYRRALELRPDAIVSDLEMPVLDGWGFLRKVRADHRIADTPLVFLSSAESFLVSVQTASAGAQDYLSKHGAKELLPKRLRSVLAPRVELEAAMSSTRPARSRVELTGARWTLTRFAEIAPRGSVILADGFGVYEAAFENAELRYVDATAAGTTMTGARALEAFLGVRAGDLVVGHALRKAPNMEGGVAAAVEAAAVRNNTAESLAVTRALGGGAGLRVDPAVAELYAKFGPVDGRAVVAALAAGMAPIALLAGSGVKRSPTEIESILRDLARRGVLRLA